MNAYVGWVTGFEPAKVAFTKYLMACNLWSQCVQSLSLSLANVFLRITHQSSQIILVRGNIWATGTAMRWPGSFLA
jgi:hypothetical protein